MDSYRGIMKKLLFLFLILFLTGCQSKPVVSIEFTDTSNDTHLIDVETLQLKIDRQDSFILYVSSPTCTSCEEFRPILLSWIESSHAMVYQINVSDDFKTDNALLPYSVTPTIFIIHEGILKTTYEYIKDAKIFESVERFEQALYKDIIRPEQRVNISPPANP